ncbi:hypothetical protein ACLKA6_000688 [Drosophila palustris]
MAGTPTNQRANAEELMFNPFKGSGKVARSPSSTPQMNRAAAGKAAHPSHLEAGPSSVRDKNSASASSATTPVPGESSLDTLGAKIRALNDILIGRRTIHQPIRDLVDSITEMYNNVMEERNSCFCKEQGKQSATVQAEKGKDSPIQTRDVNPRGKSPRKVKEGERKRARAERGDLLSPPPGPKKTKALHRRNIQKETGGTPPQGKDSDKREGWQTARRKRGRTKPARPDAVVIKGVGDNSYAEILRAVKSEPNLKDLSKHVRGIRKTNAGELLFELTMPSDPNTRKMQDAVQSFLGEKAEVRSLTETATMEIHDLDEVTTEEEVLESLLSQFGEIKINRTSILSLRRAYGGTQIATIKVPMDSAAKLDEAGKVRIGWVICRIRRKLSPTRCFKCMDFGHVARKCKSEANCAGLCFKCGDRGHQAKVCKKAAVCLLCRRNGEENYNHATNSSSCPFYKRALTRTRK